MIRFILFLALVSPGGRIARANEVTSGQGSASAEVSQESYEKSAPSSEEYSPWWGRSFDAESRFILASGLVTSLTASLADHTVRDHWMNHQKMSEDTAENFDFLGSGIPSLGLALLQYGSGDREEAGSLVRSLVATALWANVLKFVMNRKRPGTSTHYHSLPSGHTATAFATATSLTHSYGWGAGAPAYLLATGVGLSRLADDVHWFSDVVSGAFIGIWLGRAYHHKISQVSGSPDETVTMFIPSLQKDGVFLSVLSHF